MRDVYFYQSRQLASYQEDLVRAEIKDVVAQEQFTAYEYEVPSYAVAIKQLEIVVLKEGLEQPQSFKLWIEYHIGHQKAELKPNLVLKANPAAAEATS